MKNNWIRVYINYKLEGCVNFFLHTSGGLDFFAWEGEFFSESSTKFTPHPLHQY